MALASGLCQAKTVIGIGDYRYGPDTSQVIACMMAEDMAKKDAIARYVGEQIESSTFETCSNESCQVQKDSYNNLNGYVKKIYTKQEKKIELQGYTSCIVTIRAEVETLKNEIKFSLNDDVFRFMVGEDVIFRGVTNRIGNVVIYDLYDNNFVKVYQEKIATPNKEFMLPSTKNRIVAKLPDDKLTSKEVLMFIFTENDYEFRNHYTELEMKTFIGSIPSHQRQVINRYVYIMRSNI